ncbi:outer membrane protein assembly factor BamB family protein [Alienimonas californiensis]|uniref:Outer membrane biogenesis protein BamB n=1 Tax=Alienimonas californiensis TaxID=2527989 RepID=A0A517PAH4_9PLAN|nr:PQQ-binding-like beta-propeller repeat protein [Alienimonas californiensis]QDT16361.1 outer membrane biogenesis protein BamB [Alienimonas californiensis]
MIARLVPLLLLTAGLSLGATLTSAAAGDWAYWRGPEGTGVSRETGLIDDWNPGYGDAEAKNLLWTSETGGRATPVIFDGRAYLNTRTEADVRKSDELIDAQQMTLCWDMETGEELWRDVFPVAQTDIPSNRVGWASPTVDAETGNVFVHTVDGLLICYSPDGKRLWEVQMYELLGHISGYGGRTTTPIVDEDRVIVSFIANADYALGAPPPKQRFYAFDVRNGDVLWESTPGGPAEDTIYTNPVVAVIGGVRQLISGNADGGVSSLEARTGKVLWTFQMSKRGLNASPVVGPDGLVYISHGEDNIDTTEGGLGRVQCIDPTLGTDELASGDLTENPKASVWRENGAKAGYTGLLLQDDMLFVVTDVGKLHAYDAQSGERLWAFTLGTVGKGSPVWADGKIYVMENAGRVWILKPSREECEVLSEVVLQADTVSGPDEVTSSPAISDGRILLVGRDRTYCIGAPEKAKVVVDVPPLPMEADVEGPPATLRLVPSLVSLKPGESREFEVRAYNEHGRFLRTVSDAELSVSKPFPGLTIDGRKVTVQGGPNVPADGVITAKLGDLTNTAQVRFYPPLPWKYDFNELSLEGRPAFPAWVGAAGKFQPVEKGDGVSLLMAGGEAAKGKPSFDVWVGPPAMTGYVVQADFMVEGRRRLASVGITNEKYSLISKANRLLLELQSWQAHLRLQANTKFNMEPGEWYTLKLAVEQIPPTDADKDGSAIVRGKVWPRGEEEPADWTLTAEDPHPTVTGSAGIYAYRLADSYIDNFAVLPAE